MNAKQENRIWLYKLALPLMYLLAFVIGIKKILNPNLSTYSWIYDKYCPSVLRVRKESKRWGSLDELYNYEPQNGFYGIISNFWMGIRNAQAVRNRYRIVTKLIRQYIADNSDREVRIASLASGSAQAVIEAARGFENVKILAIDQDESALKNAERLARENGVTLVSKVANVINPDYLNGFDPDIVEVVGLMDYLHDKTLVGFLKRLKRKYDRALLITAHIHPNSEQIFLKKMVDWSMLYRQPLEMKHLIESSGFKKIEMYTEVHGIHTVYVAN